MGLRNRKNVVDPLLSQLASGREVLRRLHFHRQLGAGDQRSVLVQAVGQNRLIDFERILDGLVGTIEKIRLVAERQRDPPGHRVLFS
jgi:hypothetical protein